MPGLHYAVHCYSMILVEKKAVDTCRHTHMPHTAAWSHVSRVEKNPHTTP